MELSYTFTIGAMAGTFVMVIVYLYLYIMYHERSMGLWTLSWSILFLRLIIFDSGMFDWRHVFWGFTSFSILLLLSTLLFLWAAYIFVDKPMNKIWILGGVCTCLIGILVNLLNLSLFYRLLPLAWFCGTVCVWAGVVFIRYLKTDFLSNRALGGLYILWGIHTFDMPFLVHLPWFAPWGYMIEGFLRLSVAIASLMFYLEQTRYNLAQKESQYRLLADNAVDIIYLYKFFPEAKVEYISPSVTAVTGYTPREYYENANLLFDMIHPNDIPLFGDYIRNPCNSKTVPFMLRISRRDQTISWIEQNVVRHFDKFGNLISIEGIMRDVTSRINLEQSVSRLDRMNIIGEMAANVAHEIRNPLTTVRGYLQMMINKKEFTAYKDRFELMIDELDRTNAIIREYLSLSKNKLVELQNKDLNRIISLLLPLIEADAIAKKVLITRELGNIPLLYLDENEMRQLLLNLVRNGIEAMPNGGALHISTSLEKDRVVLAIRDHGCGIPPDILENLGTPFQTTKENGTGLGLPVCYRIAARHNAAINVETSEHGTTFYVHFNTLKII